MFKKFSTVELSFHKKENDKRIMITNLYILRNKKDKKDNYH